MKKTIPLILTVFILLTVIVSAFASESRVKSFAQLKEEYPDHFLYLALDATETDGQGKEIPSDTFLLPGDTVKIRVYFKTDYYSSPASPVFIWSGDFFELRTETLTANTSDDFKFRNLKLKLDTFSGHCSENAVFTSETVIGTHTLDCVGMDYLTIGASFSSYLPATYDSNLVGSYGEIWDSDTYFTEFELQVKDNVPLGAEAVIYSPGFEWAVSSRSPYLPGNIFFGEEKGVQTGSLTTLRNGGVTVYDEESNPGGRLHLEDTFLSFTCAPDHSHDYEDKVTAPTCTEKGFTTHRCKVCGHEYKDTFTSPTGHKYTEKITKYPSCTEEGLKVFTCTCGHRFSEILPVKSHTAGEWEYSGNGFFEKKCSSCLTPLDKMEASLESDVKEITLENASSFTFTPEIKGPGSLTLSYSSDKSAVARVSQSGEITALSPGSCTVTAAIKGTDISVSIPVTVAARKFTVTWKFGSQTITEEHYEGEKLTEPELKDEPWITFRYWQPAVPGKMPSRDISFSAAFSIAVYKVTFVADSVTVGEAEYSQSNKEISEPDVPYRKGYEGKWSNYTLTPGGITVEAVYTPATRISIRNAVSEREVNYGSVLILSADVYEDAGNEIIWYAGGTEAGRGNQCRFENIEEGFTVTVSTSDAEGNMVISGGEKITVRKNIFLVIIAFFRNLLRLPEVNTQ